MQFDPKLELETEYAALKILPMLPRIEKLSSVELFFPKLPNTTPKVGVLSGLYSVAQVAVDCNYLKT